MMAYCAIDDTVVLYSKIAIKRGGYLFKDNLCMQLVPLSSFTFTMNGLYISVVIATTFVTQLKRSLNLKRNLLAHIVNKQ